MRLLRSKFIRTLQLLNLAKQKNLIDDEQYAQTTKKYRKKISSLPVDDGPTVSYTELIDLAWKMIVGIVVYFAIAFFLPIAINLTSVKPLYLFVAFGSAIMYLVIVYILDKYEPEPKVFVAGAFIWGAVSTIIALKLNMYTHEIFGSLFISTCLAGFTEELAKGIGLYRLAKHPEYNDTLDAIVYGFAIGLGFAAVENLFYYADFIKNSDRFRDSLTTMVAIRASLCALAHAVFTTTIALMLARAKQIKGMPTFWDFIYGYFIAALIHGAFNYFALTIGGNSIVVNGTIVMTGLCIFWFIIIDNWKKVRDNNNYFKGLGVPSDI